MSDKYTPKTEDVRRAYREHCRDYDAVDGLATSPESYEEEFNLWRNKDRAEAQVEVLREAADSLNTGFQDIPAWTEAYEEGVRTPEWMAGGVRMVTSAIDVLTARADRIAREAGIETEEKN